MSTSCASDGRGGGVAFGISGVASTCLAHSGWNHLGLCLDWASVDRSTFIVYYYGSQKSKKQLDYGRAQTKIQNTSIHVQVSRVPRLTQRIRLVLGGLVSHNLDVQINSLNKRRLELWKMCLWQHWSASMKDTCQYSGFHRGHDFHKCVIPPSWLCWRTLSPTPWCCRLFMRFHLLVSLWHLLYTRCVIEAIWRVPLNAMKTPCTIMWTSMDGSGYSFAAWHEPSLRRNIRWRSKWPLELASEPPRRL